MSEWVDKRGITHWRGAWTAGVECSMCGWEHRENLYYADAGYTNQAANRHVKSLRHRWRRLASNVVAAQEFLWLSLQFPVEAATPSAPHSAEALDLDAIEANHKYIPATGNQALYTDRVCVGCGEWECEALTLIAAARSRDAEVAELKAKIAELTQEVQDADSAIAEAIVRGW